MDMKDKVALVTGGASGLGEATARALAAKAVKVALFDRNGPVSADTQRRVEDAILTRARQLRVADADL